MTVRTPFVGGNWKCNGTVASVDALVSGLNVGASSIAGVDVVVAPMGLHVGRVSTNLSAPFQVAVQNCSLTGQGAFTGEISADQIADLGLRWVVIGHSERRHKFGETDANVQTKVAAALAAGLRVIACIGETLDQRKSGQLDAVLQQQMQAIRNAVTNASDWSRVVIAYEPVWAIGTGVVATSQQAQDAHLKVRQWMTSNVSSGVAQTTRIVYGGSVKPKNSDELIKNPDVDGFLVGGASLKSELFLPIIASAQNSHVSPRSTL